MGHQVCSEEMDEIAKFLSERLSPGGDEEKPKTEEEAEKSEL